jgi:hypothetical protein
MIDNKLYGRKHMQTIGFMMDFILFTIPAFKFDYYTSPAGVGAFQAMYFLSSFFNQFGPNAVTFLVAAEVYPTAVRATAHGFSAACGKLGALLAASKPISLPSRDSSLNLLVLYNYITITQIFLVVPWFGLGGMLVTVLFLPDTTGLDLKEQERRWNCIRRGREDEYHGVAVHPKHLSLWERWRGVGKNYNPHLDYKQKIEEMRSDWEAAEARKAEEKDGHIEVFEDGTWSGDVSAYFGSTHTAASTLDEKVGTETDAGKIASTDELSARDGRSNGGEVGT